MARWLPTRLLRNLGREARCFRSRDRRSYRKLRSSITPDSTPRCRRGREVQEAVKLTRSSRTAKAGPYDQLAMPAPTNSRISSTSRRHLRRSATSSAEMFGGQARGGGGRRVRRGADVRVDVTLTLEEAGKGVVTNVEFPRSKACQKCKGSGSKPGSQRTACPTAVGAADRAIRRHPPRTDELAFVPGRRIGRD